MEPFLRRVQLVCELEANDTVIESKQNTIRDRCKYNQGWTVLVVIQLANLVL